MKRNMIKTLGTVILLAAVGISGCTIREETDDDKKDDKEEEILCEDDDEENLSGSCCPDGDDFVAYSSCITYESDFVSTYGRLPEQLEYMTLIPPCEETPWESYEIEYISDLSVIENNDLRAIAEEYSGAAYSIVDPEQDQEFGLAYGDGEYMFTRGFSGERYTDSAAEYIHAYEMNEDLFEYFFVGPYSHADLECSDDGSVIRYSADGFIAEYNRDTGIGFLYTGCYF